MVPQTPLTPYCDLTNEKSVHTAVDMNVYIQNDYECQQEWFHLASTSLGNDSQSAGSTSKVSMTGVLGKCLEQEGGKDVDSILAFVSAKQLGLRQIIMAGLRALKSENSDSAGLGNSCARDTPNLDYCLSQQPSPMVPSVSSLPTLFSNGIFLRHHALHQIYDQNARAVGLSLEAIMRLD